MNAFALVNIPLCSQINILVIFFPFVILVPSGMFFSTGWASTVLLFAQFFFFAGEGKNNKFAEELKSRVSHEDEVLEAVLYMCVQTMPEAAGAVAAGAVADRLLGPREQRQLAIILVG
jgi:hypothetical protein